jgi:hypothetical protein
LSSTVEYHGNGSYDFGDSVPAVIAAWKNLLERARAATASWGLDTASIELLKAEAKEKIAKTQAEQWVINKSVHFNPWTNLQAEEFRTVATAFGGYASPTVLGRKRLSAHLERMPVFEG